MNKRGRSAAERQGSEAGQNFMKMVPVAAELSTSTAGTAPSDFPDFEAVHPNLELSPASGPLSVPEPEPQCWAAWSEGVKPMTIQLEPREAPNPAATFRAILRFIAVLVILAFALGMLLPSLYETTPGIWQ